MRDVNRQRPLLELIQKLQTQQTFRAPTLNMLPPFECPIRGTTTIGYYQGQLDTTILHITLELINAMEWTQLIHMTRTTNLHTDQAQHQAKRRNRLYPVTKLAHILTKGAFQYAYPAVSSFYKHIILCAAITERLPLYAINVPGRLEIIQQLYALLPAHLISNKLFTIKNPNPLQRITQYLQQTREYTNCHTDPPETIIYNAAYQFLHPIRPIKPCNIPTQINQAITTIQQTTNTLANEIENDQNLFDNLRIRLSGLRRINSEHMLHFLRYSNGHVDDIIRIPPSSIPEENINDRNERNHNHQCPTQPTTIPILTRFTWNSEEYIGETTMEREL